ncbi:rp42 related [Anaeramoeba ignava]|uniref:Defective in cullin neddylation protein n=1 Tax=Anaeramoeba ignava TaxID=1746090 RepID=A0A9Q0RF74_ANAIG|nr:rp42 related [Anaeramoeba ignava]
MKISFYFILFTILFIIYKFYWRRKKPKIKLTPLQEKNLKIFESKIQTKQETSIVFLQKNFWDVPSTISDYQNFIKRSKNDQNLYFLNQLSQFQQEDKKNLERLFNKYKDLKTNCIELEGTKNYFQDIKVDPLAIQALILVYYIGAKEMCKFTYEEFVGGWLRLSCSDLKLMKQEISSLSKNLSKEEEFENFYDFVFDFGKNNPNQKFMDLDCAIYFWDLILKKKFFLLEEWINFLKKQPEKIQIRKDTWTLFYEFVTTISTDFKNYDESSSWPVLFDEFVAEMKEKQNEKK